MKWIIQAPDGSYALDMGTSCKWAVQREFATRFYSKSLAEAIVEREEQHGKENLKVHPDLRVLQKKPADQ